MKRIFASLTVIFLVSCDDGSSDADVEHDPYELRVGSFNVEKLGQDLDTDLSLVAKIIEENFDVIAIEEIMVADGGPTGYHRLMDQLGEGWSGYVTDRPRPDALAVYAEYYAVLWRTSLVRPCEGWTSMLYHPDNPGGPSGTGENLFSREPAYVCLEALHDARGHPVVGFDFVIAAYHALYAGGDEDVTRAEVDHLDDVFDSMAAAAPGELDLIIAGDINLEPHEFAPVVECTILTDGSGSTVSDSGSISGNLIDHVMVHDLDATCEHVGAAQILDVRWVASTDADYSQRVSDHLPVMARFTVDADDD